MASSIKEVLDSITTIEDTIVAVKLITRVTTYVYSKLDLKVKFQKKKAGTLTSTSAFSELLRFLKLLLTIAFELVKKFN